MVSDRYLSFYSYKEVPELELFGYERQLRAVAAQSYSVAKENSALSVLIFGLPGTGKSVLPFVLAKHMKDNFRLYFSLALIKCDELILAKDVSKEIDLIARVIELSKIHAPSLIMFDEIDTLFTPISKAFSDSTKMTVFIRRLVSQQPPRTLLIGNTDYPNRIDFAVHRYFRSLIYLEPTTVCIVGEIIRRILKIEDSEAIAQELWRSLDEMGFVPMASDIFEACEDIKKRHAGRPISLSVEKLAESLAALTPGLPKDIVEQYEENQRSLIARSKQQEAYWNMEYQEAT